MAYRHGAILALLSWLLISPPVLSVGADRQVIGLKAPMWQWKIEKTFDSADQCAKEKRERQQESKGSEERELWSAANNDAQLEDKAVARYEVTLQMKCISRDDPRLKRK